MQTMEEYIAMNKSELVLQGLGEKRLNMLSRGKSQGAGSGYNDFFGVKKNFFPWKNQRELFYSGCLWGKAARNLR